MTEANAKGFDAVYALRKEFVPADFTTSERRDLHAFALKIYRPWCLQAAHAEDAAKLATTLAMLVAGHDLAAGANPARAIETLTEVWPFRDKIDYRACELALTMAEAHRAARDYAGVERALDDFASLRGTAPWHRWGDHEKYGPMLPVHELVHECRRAMLELELGNPDGAIHRVLAAKHRQQAVRNAPAAQHAEDIAEAWRAADVEFHRTCIDCYLATGAFARAAAVADQVLGDRNLHEHHPMFELCRALAEYWDPRAAPAAAAAAREVLQKFARNANAEWADAAKLCLLEGALRQADRTVTDATFAAWLRDDAAPLAPRATTLQTEWLLRRDQHEPQPADRIAAQAAVQARAWQTIAASWATTPVRDGGVGFLHYVHRRDDLAQLVAITLRAGKRDGAPTTDAVARALEYVMAAQTHGALARALVTPTPTAKAVQAALRPGHTVLVFLPATAGTHVFAVTADHIDHRLLGETAVSLRSSVQGFLDLLHQATDRVDLAEAQAKSLAVDLRTAGRALVQLLFPAELQAHLTKSQGLTVIGAELLHGPIAGRAEAGFLNYLPLECLPWTDDQLFGQRFAMDHNASLPAWLQLMARDGATGPGSELVVFGVLREGEGATPQLGSDETTDGSVASPPTAAKAPKFAAVRRYLDERCTLANVLAERRGNGAGPRPKAGRVAVFLGHGGYDAANERGSWFQLQDQRLHCEHAQALGCPETPFADVVVLGACSVAKGPSRAGDSLANLGGAFLLAGATTVVQSRFAVPLRATHALLDTLLEDLAAGTCYAEAMRRARARPAAASGLDAYRACVLQVHGCGHRTARR